MNTAPWHHHRRGFALPVVLLLAMLVGVVAAVVLERQGNERRIIERQIRSYSATHFERGLREVVGEWTNSLVGQPIERLVTEDGHALDLLMGDGSTAAVYMFDAQGSVLTEPQGLTSQEREDALGILQSLGALTGYEPDPAWLRPVGPVRICARSAPPEVLEAVAHYATGGRGGQANRRFAESIVAARASGSLTQADIETAMGVADIGAQERPIIQRLLTVEPDLWTLVVDVYDPSKPSKHGGPTVRYAGRFMRPGAEGNRQVSLQSLGKFLSWEELPVDPEPLP